MQRQDAGLLLPSEKSGGPGGMKKLKDNRTGMKRIGQSDAGFSIDGKCVDAVCAQFVVKIRRGNVRGLGDERTVRSFFDRIQNAGIPAESQNVEKRQRGRGMLQAEQDPEQGAADGRARGVARGKGFRKGVKGQDAA